VNPSCSACLRSDGRRRARVFAGAAVLALALFACGSDSPDRGSPGDVEAEAPPGLVITPEGVGDLRLGQSSEEAVATGLVSDLVPRCDLGDGPALHGELRGGLEGSVTMMDGMVYAIEVASGAETDLGLGPGDDIDDVSRLYPSEDYDVAVDDYYAGLFGGRLITIEQDGTQLYSVLADESGDAVAEVSVPGPMTCD
jgi:hypothetical protein